MDWKVFYKLYFLNFLNIETSEEKDKLKRYAQIYHKEITHVLTGVRREMLLLLKINEFLRNIDRKIGNPYNTIENTVSIIHFL